MTQLVIYRSLYFDKVRDVDLEDCKFDGDVIKGTVSIETYADGWKDFTGTHGPEDYLEEYGFIIEK